MGSGPLRERFSLLSGHLRCSSTPESCKGEGGSVADPIRPRRTLGHCPQAATGNGSLNRLGHQPEDRCCCHHPPHTHRHAHTPTPPHTHTHTHTHTRAHTQTHTQASGRTRPPLQLARVRGLRRQPRSFWPLGCGRPPAGRESPPGGDTPAAAATHRPGQVAGSRGLERVGRRPPHLLPAVRRQSRAHAHGGYAGAHPPSHAHTRGVTLALTRRHTHTHTHTPTTHSHWVQPQARPLAHTLIQMYTHSATYWDTPSNRHIHGHTQTHTPSPRYTHAIQSRHAETYSAHPPPRRCTPRAHARAHTHSNHLPRPTGTRALTPNTRRCGPRHTYRRQY